MRDHVAERPGGLDLAETAATLAWTRSPASSWVKFADGSALKPMGQP